VPVAEPSDGFIVAFALQSDRNRAGGDRIGQLPDTRDRLRAEGFEVPEVDVGALAHAHGRLPAPPVAGVEQPAQGLRVLALALEGGIRLVQEQVGFTLSTVRARTAAVTRSIPQAQESA
jgi:hypothetical protein